MVQAKVNELLKENLEEEKVLKKDLNAQRRKLDRLEEKYIEDSISQEVFEKHKMKYNAKISELEQRLGRTPIKSSNLDKAIKKGIDICSDVASVWAFSDYQGKRELQRLVFTEGITLNKENRRVRTERMNTLIFQIAHQAGVYKENKTGANDFSIIYPRLVEPKGVEPSTS